MTLEEAILHCEEVARSTCSKCGVEHKQLAQWLLELKLYRDKEEKEREYMEHFQERSEMLVKMYSDDFPSWSLDKDAQRKLMTKYGK